MTIRQSSSSLITNWKNFDIGRDAKVEFIQPSSSAVALNRVTGGSATQIFGMLKANGRVFLVNPEGILFGATARVDAGGLVASTMNISDQDFLAGKFQFDLGNAAGRIQNFGELVSRQGGFVALLGAEVDNAGRIVATGSQAALAAGSKVKLQLGESGLIGMEVDAAKVSVNVGNSGVIVAEGGNVLMSAQGAQNLLAGAVNHSGVIRATRIEGSGGEVRLSGDVVSMSPQATIQTQGEGASVVLRSTEATRFDGRIDAPGAFVDTSSSGKLRVTGAVTAGEWLLDPPTLTIVETVTGADQQSASSIQNSLNTGTNVVLQALQTITVDADISKTSGGAATLTFASEQPGGGAPANTSASFFINKQISSIAGPLSIQFGGSAADSQGSVTLSAPLATNGGSVTFHKPTNLAHASPVSTKITESSSAQSGNIVFNKDVFLMAPGYAVSLNTQGPQSGGSYTGKGGDIDFKANIYSKAPVGLPSYAQALTLDTTGYNAALPLTGPGQIRLGSAATHVVGGSNRTAGSVDAIRSLTLLGPMSVDLNAGTINIVSSNGDVLVAESRLGSAQNAPDILLKAPETVINVYGDPTGNLAGNVAGYTDYVQSTFDIVGTSANQTLTIHADRAIKLIDRSISPAAGQTLQVALNPNQAGGSGVGGIVMNNASVATGGAAFSAGSIAQPALGNGADAQLLTDGFYAFNSQIDTVGANGSGTLTIMAEAPRDTAAGAGIRLVGAETVFSSGSANLTLVGKVDNFAASGNKEGVIIGEGGNARVTLNATSGNISITGDASLFPRDDSVTGGSSYTGVVLSSRALIETTSGNITIEGKGGGGDKVFIAENHGIRFSDAGTSVISASGNIAFAGTSGGKTRATSGANSFGIYAEGANMYVGTPDTAYETLGANLGLLKAAGPTATGNITFAGDSMQFVNTSTNHLKVASKGAIPGGGSVLDGGELRIHTLNAGTRIESGTPGEVADADNRATLYLGSNWFNGSVNGIFQPGFRNIVIGNAGSNVLHAQGEVAVIGSTVPLTIAQATTFRDNLVLDMSGVGGSVLIPANLIVQGSGSAARTLTINTQAGATATGIVTVASLQLLGSGDQTFTAGNLVGTLAAAVNGKVTLNNAQALTVGRVGVFGVLDGENVWLDRALKPTLPVPAGEKATVGVTSTNQRVTLTTTTGSITLSDFINSGTEDTLLYAVAGSITQLPTVGARDGYVNARGLSAVAPSGVDLFQSAQNDVDVVAGRVTNGDFALRDKDGFSVGTVASHMPPATNPPGASAPLQGIIASANADLKADTGSISQTQYVQAAGLRAQAPAGNVELDGRKADGGMADWNNVSTLSGRAGTRFAWRDADDVTVATVQGTAGIEAGLLIDLRSQAGAIGQTSAGYVKANDLHLGAATGVRMDTAVNDGVSTNAVSRLSGSTLANDFVYRNAGNLTLDTVAEVAGVSAPAGNISLESGRLLDSGGLLNQTASGAVKANALRVIAANGIALNQSAGNDVVTLGGSTAAGNLAYTDANDVTVAAVEVAVNSNRPLRASGLSAPTTGAGQGLVDIVSTSGLLAQTAQGAITAASLRAIGPKGVALAVSDTNDVATLAGRSTDGHFAYRDSTAFTVGSAGTSAGIAANSVSGTADLQASAGDITQTVAGVITAHALRALATTGVELSTAGNDVDLLAGATTSGDFRFRDINALTVGTVASTRDAAVKTVGITTDRRTATVDLQAAGALAQNLGTVAANKLRLDGQSVDFKDRANQISELAGRATSGGFAFYAGSDLTIGQVEPTAGVLATSLVDIQARGNLVLKQPVAGVGAGNEMTDNAVILRSEKRFHNETGLGRGAINAAGGRWLVYDDNPLLLDKNMKGLAADREFLLVDTRYQDYPPNDVYARGDGYITTAKLLEPADVVRNTIGHQSVAVGNNVRQVASASLTPSAPGRAPVATPAVTAAPSLAAAAPSLPLQANVSTGAPFRLDLKPLVGNGRLVSVTSADGSPVSWAAVDSANGQLIGSAPSSAQLEVSVMAPGEAAPRRLRISLQAR
jgi:filamentous hemagglutinin family protein